MKKLIRVIFCLFFVYMQNVFAAMTAGIIPHSATVSFDTVNETTGNPFHLSAQPQSIIAANSFTPLTQFSIHSLKMVGALIIDQQHWAILTTTNGITSAVTVGAHVGQEHAEVININTTTMTLRVNQLSNGITRTNTFILSLPENA